MVWHGVRLIKADTRILHKKLRIWAGTESFLNYQIFEYSGVSYEFLHENLHIHSLYPHELFIAMFFETFSV